ncbi:N-ATPase subunit AtpR [Rhodopila globiformis]|nr:ATP synthase subunit I [Rhodopila globiformis]
MIAEVAWLAAGLAAGTLHFALLRWNAALYGRAGGIGGAVALQLLRLAVLGGVLAVIATYGALPLLLAALGVVAARPVVVRLMAPAP